MHGDPPPYNSVATHAQPVVFNKHGNGELEGFSNSKVVHWSTNEDKYLDLQDDRDSRDSSRGGGEEEEEGGVGGGGGGRVGGMNIWPNGGGNHRVGEIDSNMVRPKKVIYEVVV